MARVVKTEPVQFRCHGCKATIEAEECEFRDKHTMPPTWSIKCPNCNLFNTVSPTQMIAKKVGWGF